MPTLYMDLQRLHFSQKGNFRKQKKTTAKHLWKLLIMQSGDPQLNVSFNNHLGRKEHNRTFLFCPYQTKLNPNHFGGYLIFVKHGNYKRSSCLMTEQKDKTKHLLHYLSLKFFLRVGMEIKKICTNFKFWQTPWREVDIDRFTQLGEKPTTNLKKVKKIPN